ncbi:MAG: methylase [Gammaproteobacteria bacterium]|nr:MAG: methylase [Gammaproteobacteria bacterium]
MKPFSQACENNKDAILSVIALLLKDKNKLLEVGSGTGQHAVYFSEKLPHLHWQTSDMKENHGGINQWIEDTSLKNIERPIEIDVLNYQWSKNKYSAIYSANTVHIMSWYTVQAFFHGVGETLDNGGLFILYGPFNYNGKFTSDSNERFEQWLKDIDEERGIRDFEAVNCLAEKHEMKLIQDYEMPANNRILVWQKDESA